MNHLLRPRIWPSFLASLGVGPCDVPFRYASGPIPQYRGTVARWHAHLRGLATAIHETSGLMTRRPGSTEDLHIGFDQASEKAAEWPLWFEVSFGIFLKGLHTARRTKVVRSAFIGAHRGVRIPRLDLHPAHRVHKFFLTISSH